MRKGKGNAHHEEEHENHEAWVIPYADMITLLMGLFIVMWSIGNADLAKLEAVQSSFSGALGMGSAGGGPLDGGDGVLESAGRPSFDLQAAMLEYPLLTAERLGEAVQALDREEAEEVARELENEQLTEVERRITRHAEVTGVSDAVHIRREDRGLVVSIVSDQVLFVPGSADLRPEGREILDGLADALLELPNHVAIEGHTDDVPISTARFPSNWELSTARSTSVLQYFLQRYDFPPDRLTAAGYAEQRPVAANDSVAGRAQNRRVDIAVLAIGPVPSRGDQT